MEQNPILDVLTSTLPPLTDLNQILETKVAIQESTLINTNMVITVSPLLPIYFTGNDIIPIKSTVVNTSNVINLVNKLAMDPIVHPYIYKIPQIGLNKTNKFLVGTKKTYGSFKFQVGIGKEKIC